MVNRQNLRRDNMTKSLIILLIAAIASALFVVLPEASKHLGDGMHFATLIISGHHILDEVMHGIHARKA
jgi:hypothetical protein